MIGVLDIFRNINDVKSMVNRMTGAHAKYILSNITGESDGMQEVKKMIKLSGLNDSSILIQGEVGTGKKIIAQAIHNSSIRKEGPFVVMNCATFPRNLIESELFGYEEGSFTARNKGGRPGKLEMANGGTLLLEEIGDIPVEIQSKLLRVLQKKSVIRVGGFREIPVDVRLIAASSKNLIDLISHNNFLEDLYFMINVTEIQVPPLRDRKGDIDLIADQMINQHNLVNGSNKTISDQARVLLHSWYWPGNVRELEKTIEYSFYLTERNEILPEHLRGKIMNQAKLEEENSLMTLKQAEAIVIKNALEYSSGNVTKAAKILDIGRNTLYEKMRKYGLNSLDSKIKMTNM
jgi:transcriptional regulator with PAS, ATPase and Fis domain